MARAVPAALPDVMAVAAPLGVKSVEQMDNAYRAVRQAKLVLTDNVSVVHQAKRFVMAIVLSRRRIHRTVEVVASFAQLVNHAQTVNAWGVPAVSSCATGNVYP